MKPLVLLLMAWLLAGCGHLEPNFSAAGHGDNPGLNDPTWSSEELAALAATLERCRAASRVEVFEGLPWQDSSTRDSGKSNAFENHGFTFYSSAMQLPSSQRTLVLARVLREASYEPRWPKYCAFHPDLLVRFHRAAGVIDLHICLGCSEAMFFGGQHKIYVDVQEDAVDFLEQVRRAHSKRPVR